MIKSLSRHLFLFVCVCLTSIISIIYCADILDICKEFTITNIITSLSIISLILISLYLLFAIALLICSILKIAKVDCENFCYWIKCMMVSFLIISIIFVFVFFLITRIKDYALIPNFNNLESNLDTVEASVVFIFIVPMLEKVFILLLVASILNYLCININYDSITTTNKTNDETNNKKEKDDVNNNNVEVSDFEKDLMVKIKDAESKIRQKELEKKYLDLLKKLNEK